MHDGGRVLAAVQLHVDEALRQTDESIGGELVAVRRQERATQAPLGAALVRHALTVHVERGDVIGDGRRCSSLPLAHGVSVWLYEFG